VRAVAKSEPVPPRIARRGSAAAGALVAALAAACGASEAPAARAAAAPAAAGAPPPNLLLVVIDTLRRDHLGLHGYPKPVSPNLDAFAREAAVFDRCVAASSWTEPSTASLLSGLYPARHGAHEYARVPPEAEMLAELLQAAGYRTGGVSGNPNASPLFGFDQGFDHFHFPGTDVAREYPDVSELVARAEEFLAQDDGRPLFLYLHVMNVHGPYRAPPEFRARFLEEPHAEFPFQNELWIDLLRRGRVERRGEVGAEQLRDLRARYDGAIAYPDQVLGHFLRRRRAAGGAGRDLVVITSDHGEELFDHGGFGHGFTLHRELIDVPLLLRRPGGEGGGLRIDAPVSLVDLPATLLDLLGLQPAGSEGRVGDGISLRPLLEGGAIERDAPIVAQLERGRQGAAFLVQRWPLRVIETERDYAGRTGVLELFDLAADPAERRDLAAEDPERAARLRAALRARRAALESQGLDAERPALDERTLQAMQALGY